MGSKYDYFWNHFLLMCRVFGYSVLFFGCIAHANYEHDRPGQVCDMLPVPEDNLSSMIYLSSNGLSGPKRTLNCKYWQKNLLFGALAFFSLLGCLDAKILQKKNLNGYRGFFSIFFLFNERFWFFLPPQIVEKIRIKK